MSQDDSHEPVTVTDKRRIDPVTGELRERATGPAPSGPEPEAAGGPTAEDNASELLADLQRVQADFANYRKRSMRDQQVAAQRAKASVIMQLLPVLDDLDRARSHGDLHEAVQHEGEGTHPIVGTVMRRGYKVGDQVVRHALVGVVDTVPDVDEAADTPDNGDEPADQPAES